MRTPENQEIWSVERVYAKLTTLPPGYSEGWYQGRRYRLSLRSLADGKINSFQATELGGNGYISLNFYRLSSGNYVLKPCEMPAQKVIDFIAGVEPVGMVSGQEIPAPV